jgi:pectate lyase
VLLVAAVLVVVLAAGVAAGVVAQRTSTRDAVVASFPGAQGFGATTPGGRGGKVLHVTSLADSGPGTLREALTARGPRVVVFDTGGTIKLASSIRITHPYVTVAGQTAPGDGIALRMRSSQDSGLLDVNTHDVVIRGVRFRQGPHERVDAAIPLELADGAERVVIDHNSLSWATDEVLTTYDHTADITISWNIIAEGLSHSRHYRGEHSRGLFLSGDDSRDITAHHNLLAHNMRRNPEVSISGIADIRNNVIYGYGTFATLVSDKRDSPGMNVVGNFYKPGPDSSADAPEIRGDPEGSGLPLCAAGNLRSNGRPARLNADANRWLVSAAASAPPVATTSALQAYDDVLAGAGSRAPRLDSVDQRIIADVRNGTGHIIDDPAEVGGWPDLAPGTARADADADGMPDDWETPRGLDPTADDSAGDRNHDGYTNVEEYINALLPSPPHTDSSGACSRS